MGPYSKPQQHDIEYGGAADVVQSEIDHLKRLGRSNPVAGLALSGGGIRSASFALGALQAFALTEWLPKFDYLSTVSGGGYIGSSLSYLLQQKWQKPDGIGSVSFDVSRDGFPYVSFPMVSTAPGRDEGTKGALLRMLRQNAKYLTPGGGISPLSLAGVVLRNSAVSLLVYFAITVLLLKALIWSYAFEAPGGLPPGLSALNWTLWGAATLLLVYGLLSLLYAPATRLFDWVSRCSDLIPYRLRRIYEWACNWLFLIAAALLVLGSVPLIHHYLERAALSLTGAGTSTIVGLVANGFAYYQTRRPGKIRIPTGLLVAVGSTLLLFGMLLLAYEVTVQPCTSAYLVLAAVLVIVLLGYLPNLNYLSVHRYYRDRLMETFMPDVHKVLGGEGYKPGLTAPGNSAMLGRMCGAPDVAAHSSPQPYSGPYHLINTNLILVSSPTPKYRGRGGDNFVFSPLWCGSNATGWATTDANPEKGMTLATAMAISGAAVSPNAAIGGEGITRQPVLSVLMSLLNVRLGYWLINPKRALGARHHGAASLLDKPNFLWPGLCEVFNRRNLNEDAKYILLSDGGHFENLGLYELVRRRLKVIVVCDATADPKYTFSDLSNAIEKVRADFGAIIRLDSDDLQPLVSRRRDGASSDTELPPPRFADRGYLFAPIEYATPALESVGVNTHGLLIYLTTTFFSALTADLYGFRNAHPEFPDQPTSDQFFDEKQFEAYRELGFQIAMSMMCAARDEPEMLAGLRDKKTFDSFEAVGFPPLDARFEQFCRDIKSTAGGRN